MRRSSVKSRKVRRGFLERIKSNFLISFIIGTIGVVSSIIGIWSYYEAKRWSYKNVQKELVSLHDGQKWSELHKKLGQLEPFKDRDELGDLYNYYMGRLLIKKPFLSEEEPFYHMSKVRENSEYYLAAQRSLVYYILNKYTLQSITFDQLEKAYNELSKIAEIMESSGYKKPYYYLIKLASLMGHDYEEIEALLEDFKKTYSKFLDPNTLELRIKFESGIHYKPGGIVHADAANLIVLPPVIYYFQLQLAYSAHKQCLTEKRNHALNEIEKIFLKHPESRMRELFGLWWVDDVLFDSSLEIRKWLKNKASFIPTLTVAVGDTLFQEVTAIDPDRHLSGWSCRVTVRPFSPLPKGASFKSYLKADSTTKVFIAIGELTFIPQKEQAGKEYPIKFEIGYEHGSKTYLQANLKVLPQKQEKDRS